MKVFLSRNYIAFHLGYASFDRHLVTKTTPFRDTLHKLLLHTLVVSLLLSSDTVKRNYKAVTRKIIFRCYCTMDGNTRELFSFI